MALWRPWLYAEHITEEPLDLSNKTASKSEKISPQPSFSSPELPFVPGYDATYPDASLTCAYQQNSQVPRTPYAESALSATQIPPDTTQSSSPTSSTSGFHDCDEESLSGDLDYQAFERAAFKGLVEKDGGSLLGNNPRMRRAVQCQASDEDNDSYRKQCEKNNQAAKQSRDRRKLRELRLAFQVRYQKKKVTEMKARMATSVCWRCRE